MYTVRRPALITGDRLNGNKIEARQQIKWLAFAAAVASAWFLASGWVVVAVPPSHGMVEGGVVDGLLLASIPIAVGIAVLRYRLYNIDVIIKCTLVYAALSVSLALIYFGSVVGLQYVFRSLGDGESSLVVVASTLLIAALFNPLRHWVQGFVDRRFYRRKYDATKTLAPFNARLREGTELETLSGDVVGVVRETMQPVHV
ncbi:MAG: hypothetical protein AVDCRST_MAG05-4800 [uncultured Rubrobacteraceae bacterium]|uniref:Uncharacterized protein n=1 Tax=uncultured Rubrobacteraceae bacterium TaxID=349277 RepID=A0A6J4TXV6_9ACTN|nr:MAG: hypothetical protein AVDCRST_MAG05-4800 [uncultured Rubrobacteraceae bacterium]